MSSQTREIFINEETSTIIGAERLTKEDKITKIDAEIAQLEEQITKVKGTETEVYTRIVGYHRAVENWNKGKREEYKDRVTFSSNPTQLKKRLEKVESMEQNNLSDEGAIAL